MFSAALFSKQSKGSELQITVVAFQDLNPLAKTNLLSQYWPNGNTEGRGKLLTLKCNILKTGRRRKFKLGENAF